MMPPPPPSPERVVAELAAPGWPRWRTVMLASWLAGAATMAFVINGHQRSLAIDLLAPGGAVLEFSTQFYGPGLIEMLVAAAILGVPWALPLAWFGRSSRYRYVGAVRLTWMTFGFITLSLALAAAVHAIVWSKVTSRPASWWDWSSTRAITLNLIALAVNAAWFYQLRRLRSAVAEARRHLCEHCGYDIRASPDRCPECGTATTLVPAVAGSPAGG